MKRIIGYLLACVLCAGALVSCTPALSIDGDGYFVRNGVRTDLSAGGRNGRDGADGEDGRDGRDGRDGNSPDVADLAKTLGYVFVSDSVAADSGEDVLSALQKIITDNPKCTIFFPDGEYRIGGTLKTPADPEKSVRLVFSDYAVLRADETVFPAGAPLLSLGGIAAATGTTGDGIWGLEGGIFDGAGVAAGIEIAARDVAVRNCSVRNTALGVKITEGARGADLSDIGIFCTGAADATGILTEGADGSFTNIRIAGATVGAELKSTGNSLKNVMPRYTSGDAAYADAVGFTDRTGGNVYSCCFSDGFRTGFFFDTATSSSLLNCGASFTGGKQIALRSSGVFAAVVVTFRVGFTADNVSENILVAAGDPEARGYITDLFGSVQNLPATGAGREYVRGGFYGSAG